MRRIEEAWPHIELALELDPLDPVSFHLNGQILDSQHRYDDAIAAFRTALEVEPNQMFMPGCLASTLISKGMFDEALAIYRRINADDAEFTMALEDGFEKAGTKGAFRAVADLTAERYEEPGKSVRAGEIAEWYQSAGDYDLAIDWFEKANEDHDPNLPYIGIMLQHDPLRSNPCFRDLLRKMNLSLGN
jgi:tetratricopeptide (TPR) repeat protein